MTGINPKEPWSRVFTAGTLTLHCTMWMSGAETGRETKMVRWALQPSTGVSPESATAEDRLRAVFRRAYDRFPDDSLSGPWVQPARMTLVAFAEGLGLKVGIDG